MTNIKTEAEKIGKSLTAAIQKVIRAKGLVSDENKPHLVDSIEASIDIEGFDIEIKISGFEYFKYLDAEHGILEAVQDSGEYKNLMKDIESLYAKLITDSFKK